MPSTTDLNSDNFYRKPPEELEEFGHEIIWDIIHFLCFVGGDIFAIEPKEGTDVPFTAELVTPRWDPKTREEIEAEGHKTYEIEEYGSDKDIVYDVLGDTGITTILVGIITHELHYPYAFEPGEGLELPTDRDLHENLDWLFKTSEEIQAMGYILIPGIEVESATDENAKTDVILDEYTSNPKFKDLYGSEWAGKTLKELEDKGCEIVYNIELNGNEAYFDYITIDD